MADSKPISHEQVYDPRLFDPLKKEIKEVDSLLIATTDSLKSLVAEAAKIAKATPLDSFENIEKVEKSIEDTTKAVKELDKVEKDRLRLQEKLSQLDDERTKANFDLKEQIRLQTKELRDSAKAAAASGDAYERLKKETNNAQKELKQLAAQFGSNSKQAKQARKTFERLDEELREVNEAARDGRRDVGRYEKGVKGLTKTVKVFASATIILKVLDLLQTSFSQNSEGAADLEKVMVRFTTTFTVVANRLVDIFPVIQARFERFLLSIKIGFAEVKDLFGGNEEEVRKLQKEYDALAGIADKDLGQSFKGLGAEIADLTAKKIKLIDDTLKYRREIVGLEKDIAGLIPTQEKLRAQFEDDSTSLEEQIRAGVAFRAELNKRFSLEQTIAARRLKLSQENAQASKANVGAQEELSAATLEYNQLIADQASELKNTEKEIQKLRDDATQLNLDFYIDDFDNRKTVNERIIADETQTFERRKELLQQNLKTTETVFALEEEALNKSLRERGKAQIDFDELRKNSSSEEIARVVRESGISEPLAIRVLEVLRERRTFLQDNAEAQKDLNAAETESRAIQDDIILQQQALNKLQEEGVDLDKVLTVLSEARLQSDIDNLRERLAVAEEGSQQAIALNQELNDKLLEQDQNRLDKEKKIQEERLKELEKFGQAANEVFQLLSDIVEKRSEKRIEAIDKEIEAEEARAERLQELAEQGNEDAGNNLALTEQRQAELELRRQQQIERQGRSELALTAIQTYSGKVQVGDPNPLASTIADISVLRAFINALPGFYEGTEDTGIVSNPLDKKGGRLSILHDNERVIDKANNKVIGKMSNTELAMLANKEKSRSYKNEGTSAFVVRELKELKQITKDKPTYMGLDYDHIADAIVRKVQKGNKIERIHKKNGGIWGA